MEQTLGYFLPNSQIFRKIVLSLLLFSVFSITRGQTINVDSLKIQLRTLKNDTNRVSVYNSVSDLIQYKDPQSAIAYADSAIKLADSLKWDEGLSLAYKCKGNGYFIMKTMNSKAIECFLKSKEIAQKIPNEELEMNALGSLGNVFKLKSEWFDAIGYYKEANHIYEKSKNKKRLLWSESVSANNIGAIYQILGQYDLAKEYFENSYDLSIDAGNKRTSIDALNNLGANKLSVIKPDEAMTHYQLAYRLTRDPQLRDKAGNELLNISGIYELQKQFSLELEALKKADSLFKIYPDKEKRLNLLINFGSYYTATKNYVKALEFFNKSLKVSDSIGTKDYKVQSLTNIGYVDFKLGKYNLAIENCRVAADTAKKYMLTKEYADANQIIDDSNTALHERKINQQYIIIVLFLISVFSITLGIRKKRVSLHKIEFWALGSMILFFELMNLHLHSFFAALTNDNPYWMLLIMITIITLLGFLHKLLIKWVKLKLGNTAEYTQPEKKTIELPS